MNKTMKKTDFLSSWLYLQDHPLIGDGADIMHCLDIEVVKINPKTKRVEDDDKLNTEVEIWLEWGFPKYKKGKLLPVAYTHDYNLDCGASTFEEAIIKLAALVRKHYEKS